MHRDRERDHLATPSEAVAEFGRNAGEMYPDRAWLLHDWDVWVANPYYAGPPVPHPEDDWADYAAEMDEAFGPVVARVYVNDDEEIPF